MEVLLPTNARLKLPSTHFHTNPFPPSIFSPTLPCRASHQLLRTPPSAPRLRRCLAASPGPPPAEPPPQQEPTQLTGFSSLQDRIRIFFAVLFWMSLFFWASAFDKRNNGRRNKGSRFRR